MVRTTRPKRRNRGEVTASRNKRRPSTTTSGKRGAPGAMRNVSTSSHASQTSCAKAAPASPAVTQWFAETCKRNVNTMKEEFISLRKHMPAVLKVDVFKANEDKNRYRDVMCLDETRVNLVGHVTNYIHASWVDGSIGAKAFICSQGPTASTAVDFWVLIWQEEVAAVVMLCGVEENGKAKCHQYWPPENEKSQTYGEFTIVRTAPSTPRCLTSGANAMVSVLEITREGCAPRTVRHIHWSDWPDRGIPQTAQTVLKLRQLCLELSEGHPVVVHCSAGIGRTGTLVVIDICIGQLDAGSAADIPNALRKVREQRMHSVQTEIQYMFIYKALIDHCINNLQCDATLAEAFNQQLASIK